MRAGTSNQSEGTRQVMYEGNLLGATLRAASIGSDLKPFLLKRHNEPGLTYQNFFSNAEKMATLLMDCGVTAGDRVAVQVCKSCTFLELYIGTILSGGVFMPLNPEYTVSETQYFLDDAEPLVFVCDPGFFELWRKQAHRYGITSVFSLGAGGTGTLVRAQQVKEAGFESVRRGSDDLAALLYTSGTTGRSKGAMLSHNALVSNAVALTDAWRFTSADILVHALPLFHTHGLFVAIHTILLAGASCNFISEYDDEAVCVAMREATVLMGVPTIFVRLLDHPDLARFSRNMRLFVSGSAPLRAETHCRWREKTGHVILERYGMTETGMSISNPYDGERREGAVGFPLPGVEIVISDPESAVPVETGNTGVLEIRSPGLCSGYWRQPEKMAEVLKPNGFFTTGDLCRKDDDGYIHIVGRMSDLIINGGFNVYPGEIERLIDKVSGVSESAVIGVFHPEFGETVVAIVVREFPDVQEHDILEQISTGLARFKRPRKIHFVGSLPRNPMGKVQKSILREQWTVQSTQ